MINLGSTAPGQFCWADLAASDIDAAEAFYAAMFGWGTVEHSANGGRFTLLQSRGRDIGSIYRLSGAQLAGGAPSHWTSYVRVDNVDGAARQAAAIGGEVLIKPFVVSGLARIALIADPTGAQVGLWESIEPVTQENTDGQIR